MTQAQYGCDYMVKGRDCYRTATWRILKPGLTGVYCRQHANKLQSVHDCVLFSVSTKFPTGDGSAPKSSVISEHLEGCS